MENYLIFILLLIGIYLIIVYSDFNSTPSELRDNYLLKRNIGIGCVLTSLILTVYFYLKDEDKKKANMMNDCNTCQIYKNRANNLQPYKENEYIKLKEHSKACKDCSEKCVDLLDLTQQYNPSEVNKVKKDCIEKTKVAIRSTKELKRLEDKLRTKQVQHWKAVHNAGGKAYWTPFLKS